MAREAGVEMPESHLFRTKKSRYFGTKRFDRNADVPTTQESLHRPEGDNLTVTAHESGIQYGYPSGYKLDLQDRLRFSCEAGQ
jgi:hypothetical protein